MLRSDIEHNRRRAAKQCECYDGVGWVLGITRQVALTAGHPFGMRAVPEHNLVILRIRWASMHILVPDEAMYAPSQQERSRSCTI